VLFSIVLPLMLTFDDTPLIRTPSPLCIVQPVNHRSVQSTMVTCPMFESVIVPLSV